MAPHAARQNDDILHSSLLADIVSVGSEVALYAMMGACVSAALVAAAPVAAAGSAAAVVGAVAGNCVLSGIIVGAAANLSGLAGTISASADALGDALFPPTPQGKIVSGSSNVLINGRPAARAAGYFPNENDTTQATPSAEPPLDIGSGLLNFTQHLLGELWQPTLNSAQSGASSLAQDSVACEKHSGPQFLAEGSARVLINGQPAARAKDKTTCGGSVSDQVSPNVIIGGGTATVRDVKSGKLAGLTLLSSLLSLSRGRSGKISANFGCLLSSAGSALLTDLGMNALFAVANPVHAASGVKVLNDELERDFSLPGVLPLNWQRYYTSLNPRSGLFGLGWSTLFDTCLHLEGEQATWCDEMGRELCFTLPQVGETLYSGSEGLMIRRNAHGDVLIADADGELWRVYKPTRHDSNTCRLALLSDAYGTMQTLRWDEAGRLLGIEDDVKAIDLHLSYDDARHPERVTGAQQFDGEQFWPLMRWTYDEQGQLSAAIDASELTTREYRYNTDGLLVWHRTAQGLENEYRWQYFDHWRVVEYRNNRGEGSHIEYDLSAGLTSVFTYDGLTRKHYWNAEQLITCFVDERGESWQFSWNENGQLLSRTDPLGHCHRYGYNEYGDLELETLADGSQWLTLWSPQRALPSAQVDAEGNKTEYHYDRYYALSQVVDAAGQRTDFIRNGCGLIIEERDASGQTRRRDYNDAGQVIREIDCSGRVHQYDYHPLGWLIAVTDPEGEITEYQYDAAGRPRQVRRAEDWQETLEWNAQGLPSRYRSASNELNHFEYDAVGQLTTTRNGQGEVITREWDSRGRMIGLRNPNQQRYQFIWGADSQLIAQVGLDGVTTRHYYDAAGRARAQTFAHDHPQAITHYYQRDPLGRLTSRITPDTQTRFHYTANGLLASVNRYLAEADDDQPDDSLTFTYDKLGRRIGEQHQTLQCPATQLAWQYDALGNCTALTLPDGRQIRQHYYGSGHLLSLAVDKQLVSEFTRDALHREISRSQGALTQYDQYDRLGRLTDRQVFSGEQRSPLAPRFARRWQYDFSNNLVSETRQGNLFDHTLWHYDRSGHLLSQTGQQMGNEQWHYDAASNPLTHADSPPIVDNRVTELKGLRWEYDIHGRTILKQTADYRYHYRYNSEHQLIEVRSEPKLKHQDTTVTTYRYDGLGRRISKSTAVVPDPFASEQYSAQPKVTRFVWEGLRLLQEIPEYGLNKEKLYLYRDSGSYEPLARLDDNHQLYWYHTTPNGTPERLTDEAGEVRWQGVNNTWGKQVYQPMLTGGRVEQNLRMQGQYYDEESGLHYNLFRYYDPDSGRFTQLDPIGLAGGINLYQYAPNALGWVDPLGLKAGSCISDEPALGPHGSLKNDTRRGQSHHLNQDAAYRDIIPTNSGAAIKLEGNAFTDPGTVHYEAHKSLEQFWNQYRRGGPLNGQLPTNLQYTQALKHSLEDAGLPANHVNQAVRYSIENRLQHGALGGMNVPRIPGRINQVKL